MFAAIQALESATESYATSIGQPGGRGPDLPALERAIGKRGVIDQIKGIRNPSYFDEFAAPLAEHPYALPKALFDAQGKEVLTIDFPNNLGKPQFHKERTDLALNILYPGSFTYRYGVSAKIETGQWSQTFVAHLQTRHQLSPKPIFNIRNNKRILDVYRPIVLRARQIDDRNPFICMICLAISGFDEGCFHPPSVKVPRRLPSSSPVIENFQLDRKEGESIELRAPLDSLITRVTYLPHVKVGIAVLGFERSLSVPPRVTVVNYDPPLGMIMETRGLAFRINMPSAFLEELMRRDMIVRDIIVQILAKWTSDQLSDNGMPGYHLEPVLSGLIQSIGLDQKDLQLETIIDRFSGRNWIANAIQATMQEGHTYYARFGVQQARLQNVYDRVSHKQLDLSVIRNELKERILHSLAHTLLVAGCVTSGSLPTDLEYIINQDTDEIVIFDSSVGVNGSSEMIFEFCSSRESLKLAAIDEELGVEKVYSPKYFDESFAELLLPCQQGVAERIFHRGLPAPGHREIARRFAALDRQKDSYSAEYEYIATNGVENCFISSIGYRVSLAQNLSDRAAERLKETLGICVHGCPDCLTLGSRCTQGSFLEKYNVSKIVLDEYFRFIAKDVTLDYAAKDSQIESQLEKRASVILTGVTSRAVEDKIADKVQERVSQFLGRRIGSKFVKFAGFWVDSPLGASEIRYNAMLVLV